MHKAKVMDRAHTGVIAMKEWPNLDGGIACLSITDRRYREWWSQECARLRKDWARDTSRITPEYLQPMAFRPGTVAVEIKRSGLKRSPEGREDYHVADYVVGLDGKLRVGFSHTKLSEMTDSAGVKRIGMPVYAAGQMTYGDGAIRGVDNVSGHYRLRLQDWGGCIRPAFVGAGLAHLLAEGPGAPIYIERYDM